VARRWGVKQVVAETAKDNLRALATFRNRGFQMNDQQEQDVVLVSKVLDATGPLPEPLAATR
jgi:hypothetical protein